MKKIIITIIIFLFIATLTSNAQLFKNREPVNNELATGLTNNSSRGSDVEDNSVGLFRNGGSAPEPGDRPGNGGGIGQEAPLGDGMTVLIASCIIFGIIKIYNRRKKVKG